MWVCVLPSCSTMFCLLAGSRGVCVWVCVCVFFISCLDVLLGSRRAGCSGTHGQPLFCQWFRIPQTHTLSLTLSEAPHPQAAQLSDTHSTSPTHPQLLTDLQWNANTPRIDSGCPRVIDNWQLIAVVCWGFCKVTSNSITRHALFCPLNTRFSALQAHLPVQPCSYTQNMARNIWIPHQQKLLWRHDVNKLGYIT